MRILIAFFVALTLILNIAFYSLGIADIVLSVVAMFFTFVYCRSVQFSTHLCQLTVLLYVYVPTVFIPAFHFGLDELTELDYGRLASLGAKVYAFTIITITSMGILWKKNRKVESRSLRVRPISNFALNAFFIVMFGLTLFSLSIGLGVMGRENAVLPYGLGGLITMARMQFAPLFFLLVVENWIIAGKKLERRYILLFLAWTLLETFTRLSKGVLISNMLPIMLLLVIQYKPSPRKMVRYATPLVLVFLALYPIIQTMRQYGNSDIAASFQMASNDVRQQGDDDHTLRQSFNRAFMTASLYHSDYSYINQNDLFDFSNAPQIITWQGSARFQTVVIDGYPPTAHHSSGTSGILDPMLIGGYGLSLIVIFLIVCLACYVDTKFHAKVGGYMILWIIVSDLISRQNISYFFDGLFLPYFSIRFMMIFLISWFNYGFRSKKELVRNGAHGRLVR